MIGAGPGGLVAARWLAAYGLDPVIFERSTTLGGQWAGLEGRSGVWPTMHTNTSRVLTAFSDLDHESSAVFPAARDILEYLHRYAGTFGLDARIRYGARIDRLERDGDRWRLHFCGRAETFDRVVVASGRFHSPVIPAVSGLDSFTGPAGVATSYDYRDPERYRGRRVLVAGCAVSALEIAAELAVLGAQRVTVTQRRQR